LSEQGPSAEGIDAALQFRPKESSKGNSTRCWTKEHRRHTRRIAAARKQGLDLDQAEGYGLPLILLPDEKKDQTEEF